MPIGTSVNFSLSNWGTSADHRLGTFDMHAYSANLVQTLQRRLLELQTPASFHTAWSKLLFWGNTLHTWQSAVCIFLRAVILPKPNLPCNIGQWESTFLPTNTCHSNAMGQVYLGLNANRATQQLNSWPKIYLAIPYKQSNIIGVNTSTLFGTGYIIQSPCHIGTWSPLKISKSLWVQHNLRTRHGAPSAKAYTYARGLEYCGLHLRPGVRILLPTPTPGG